MNCCGFDRKVDERFASGLKSLAWREAVVREIADDQSRILGERRGYAPCFAGQPASLPRYRNATRLCIAPTGTIAILMDASSGIEPHYLLTWNRTLGNGQVLQEKIAVADQLDGFVPQTAMEIPWTWHIKHQAAAQKYVDLAVSKTINMPNSATEEEILECYLKMWQAGLKGGTIFRDGSRSEQVLSAVTHEEEHTECSECDGPLAFSESCATCMNCGYSVCSV